MKYAEGRAAGGSHSLSAANGGNRGTQTSQAAGPRGFWRSSLHPVTITTMEKREKVVDMKDPPEL